MVKWLKGKKIKSKIIKILDYLAVIRPTLLFPVWTLLLLGYYRGLSFSNALTDNPRLFNILVILTPSIEIVKTILLFSMLMGTVYIINQITDAPTDSLNDKLYLVADGYINIKILIVEAVFLSIGGIVLGIYWFGDVVFYLPLIGLSLIIGWIYSVPPIRLKSRPIFDLLANAIGYGTIAFSLGWLAETRFSIHTLLNSLPYLLCVGSTFITTTLPDIKGDRANNDITTGVFLGIKRTCFLSAILLVLAVIVSILFKDFIAFTATLLSLPLFIYTAFKPEINVILLTNKIGILILSLITCALIPCYFLLLIGTIIAVKLYYSLRFEIKYPF